MAQDGARTEDRTTAGADAGNVHGAEVKIFRDQNLGRKSGKGLRPCLLV